MRITAHYDVHLTAFLMLCVDEASSNNISFKSKVDDYDLEIILFLDKAVGYKSKNDTYHTYGSNHISVRVTRDELGDLASIKSNLFEIYPSFEKIAERGINRLIRFFKFKLNNPLLREVSCHDDPWSNNPKWYDVEGNEIDLGLGTSDCSRHLAYGFYPRFGMKALHDINDPDFYNALQKSIQPKLYEEFLADARTEIIEENYTRAVLEMAIACELFVKNAFFSDSPISGALFDYLALQRKIEVSIHELINKPAKEVFGYSFKDDYPNDFNNIGYLFQARNRVAHSGQCIYKDNKGKEKEVDEFVLEEWWQSLATLIDWLKSKAAIP